MNIFKKIWHGIKKAGHWIAEKARKFKSWCKNHKEDIVGVAGAVAVVGVGIVAAKAAADCGPVTYTLSTREEKYSGAFDDAEWIHVWSNVNPPYKIYNTDDNFAEVSSWPDHTVTFSNIEPDIFKVKDLGEYGEQLVKSVAEISPEDDIYGITLAANSIPTTSTFVEEV